MLQDFARGLRNLRNLGSVTTRDIAPDHLDAAESMSDHGVCPECGDSVHHSKRGWDDHFRARHPVFTLGDFATAKGVWTRRQLEAFATADVPEASMDGLFVKMTPKVLLLLMDYFGQNGGTVEVVKASPWKEREVELRFFKRDELDDG